MAGTISNSTTERRAHVRKPERFDVKLRDTKSRKYHPGRTVDVSEGGTLVELHQGISMRQGDCVELAIDDGGRPVIAREQMIPAVVVRSLSRDDRQFVAVRFALTGSLSKAA